MESQALTRALLVAIAALVLIVLVVVSLLTFGFFTRMPVSALRPAGPSMPGPPSSVLPPEIFRTTTEFSDASLWCYADVAVSATIDATAKGAGIQESTVRSRVEDSLKAAGVEVISKQSDEDPAFPGTAVLQANIKMRKHGESYIYVVALRTWEQRVAGKQPISDVTYELSDFGVTGDPNTPVDKLNKLADEWAERFKAAKANSDLDPAPVNP